MAARKRQHQLIEAAVANEHELQPATIDLPSLAREREQRGVDYQLLVLVGLTCTSLDEARALRGPELTVAVDSDVADVEANSKDPFDQVFHISRLRWCCL